MQLLYGYSSSAEDQQGPLDFAGPQNILLEAHNGTGAAAYGAGTFTLSKRRVILDATGARTYGDYVVIKAFSSSVTELEWKYEPTGYHHYQLLVTQSGADGSSNIAFYVG